MDPGDRDIFRRGVRLVLDKDGTLGRALQELSLPDDPDQTAQPPDEAAFSNVVHDFWYHTVWSAKKLRRGEVWTASGCINSYIKWQCLLPVITWHARATHGWDHDTWMRGRFLEKWADPRVVAALRTTFGHLDPDDLWRALFETMGLFGWLAAETAGKLGYDYPTQAEEQVTGWVKACFEERGRDE
jgi:aminoglycoside 6-adenylyltransferase